MSTPVITEKWAGSFDCVGTCRRKRLTAEEFSKRALERHRRDGTPLQCKLCISAKEQAELEQATAKRMENLSLANNSLDSSENETRNCAGSCGQTLSKSAFNRSQWSKGEGKSRCTDCVKASLQEESEIQSKTKEDKFLAAQKKLDDARKAGVSQQIFAAESELAALEAEKVTGLKPIRMRGRGRGGRGRAGSLRGRGK